jgi:hypothetical protein
VQTLFQADVAWIANHQVIQQIDFQQVGGLDQLARKIDIFG